MKNRSFWFLFATFLAAMTEGPAAAMECRWVRTTGQFPVECPPLVADVTGDSQEEILLLNRGGQILLWDGSGNPIGRGADGQAGQVEEGVWSSQVAWIGQGEEGLLVACNTEGKVIALDSHFQPKWTYSLPGKTQFGRAITTILGSSRETRLVWGDHSGTVTCLDLEGRTVWSKALEAGPIRAPLTVLANESGGQDLLVGAGNQMFRLTSESQVVWQCPLEDPILSKPEVSVTGQGIQILCGGGKGSLFGISPEGTVRWKSPVEDLIDSSIALLPSESASSEAAGASPVLCTGLFGNLHAFDAAGKPIWRHLYDAKGRATPLVLPGDSPEKVSILIPTYKHHLYVFDREGNLTDDFRFSGIPGGSLVPLVEKPDEPPDVLLVASSLLAYRLSPGHPRPTYPSAGTPTRVQLSFAEETPTRHGLVVENPDGGLVQVDLQTASKEGGLLKTGRLSVQSNFEIPLPEEFLRETSTTVLAFAKNATGEVLCEIEKTLTGPEPQNSPEKGTANTLRVRATRPYSEFDESRISTASPAADSKPATVEISSVYLGEVDQGAFILENPTDRSLQIRVMCGSLDREDGTPFGGQITLRRVVSTGTVNGERVADALPEVGDSGVIELSPREAAKIWVSVDTLGATSGTYRGTLTTTPLMLESEPLEISLSIEILNLPMPEKPPFEVCTWDYLPNQWFPDNTEAALRDMNRHGVRVFPRHACLPKGKVSDEKDLTIDWSALDLELDRLKGHGKILFQVQHPPIEFPGPTLEEDKRPFEVEYFRRFRDRLEEKGWSKQDYAFYPTDEPGYDFGKRVDPMLEAVGLYREADPRFQVYTDPVMAFSRGDYERSKEAIDIWAPNMRFLAGALSGDPRILDILGTGEDVWSYECIAQVKSLSPLRYNRAYAWRAKYFGLRGMGFWTHSTTPTDPWIKGKGINDEFALVYPGKTPVPSLRWEAVRDGIEDIAALELLQTRIAQAEESGEAADQVQAAKNWIDLCLNDLMEISDAAFIESRDYLEQGNRRIWHTPTDEATYRGIRARIAEFTLNLGE